MLVVVVGATRANITATAVADVVVASAVGAAVGAAVVASSCCSCQSVDAKPSVARQS